MATRVIDISLASQWVAQLQPALRAATVRGLQKAAMHGVATVQAQIIPGISPHPPQGVRGAYKAAWKATPNSDGAIITNAEPVAPLVEYGVRASNVRVGRKMIDALALWALRKGFANKARPSKRKAGGDAKQVTPEKEARAAAFAIAAKMKKRGIFNRPGQAPGLRVLAKLLDDYLPSYVREEVEREIRKGIG